MTEIYLRLVDLVLTPIIVIIASVLFMRGHDLPGGGFIAGLTIAAAIELHILARGAEETRARFGRYLLPLTGLGLLVAVTAALLGMYGGGFFKGVWLKTELGNFYVKFGTPQLFDLGVTLVVIGMTITYLLRLSERGERDSTDQRESEQA